MVFELIGLNLGWVVTLAILLAYVVVLFISFSMHEFAHGFAAYLHGDYTAKAMGRLTLNPLRHIDPVGMISLLLLGFGWAKPVPYNPMNLRDGRRGMFAVAVAGVLANLSLAFLFSLIYVVLLKYASGALNSSFGGVFLTYFLYLGIQINLFLMLFNLLPIFPLDGSKVMELVLKPGNKFLEFMRKYSMIILIVLIITTLLSRGIGFLADVIMNGFMSLWSFIFRL